MNAVVASASVAETFVDARRRPARLPSYPGPQPVSLAAAYGIQDEAIDLWGEPVAGWKIGRVPAPAAAIFGAERIAGPIFARAIQDAEVDGLVRAPVFADGFAAVEAEFVLRLARDADPERVSWSPGAAADLVEEMRCGIEIASSPYAEINGHGPAVTVSDFGNNAGLILGPPIDGWREGDPERLSCETFVDGVSVGRGSAASIPGGPLTALCFLLEHAARRRRPLTAGQWISTGAATGVHEIAVGQSARAVFDGWGEIRCEIVALVGGAREA